MEQQESSVSSMLERVSAQCDIGAEPAPAPLRPNKPALWSLPGFGAGASVLTAFGNLPVELLRRGDAIKTRDGAFLKIAHVDTVRLDRRFLLTHPEAQPIAIPKDGLDANIPNQATLVSSRQKIRSSGQFGRTPVQTASDYVGRSNIARKYYGYFTYHIFHCGVPCTVSVNGLWVDIEPATLETPECQLPGAVIDIRAGETA